MDVSVPADVPLTDLLPGLLAHVGKDLADRGLAHGGWVLHRLGEPPLEEDLTADALGLRDGELVYLRPRGDLVPPLDFDDLVDGVATGMRARAALWRPELTRRAAWTLVGTLLAASLALLAFPGDAVQRCLAAWLTALLLLGYAAVARSAGDRPPVVIAGIGALLHAGAGLLLTRAVAGATGVSPDSAVASALLVVALLAAAVAVVVFGADTAVRVGVLAGAGWAGAAVTAYLLAGRDLLLAATCLLTLALLVRPAVPKLAFRLSGLRLDPLAATPEDLQQRIDPVPGEALLATTSTADRIMTALYLMTGIGAGFAGLVLAVRPGWSGPVLVVVTALNQVLTVRPMTSAWHRCTLAVPALVAAGVALLAVAARTGAGAMVPVHLALLVAAVVAVGVGRALAENRVSPVAGRVGDITQFVTGSALLPCVLWVLGVYGSARALVA